MRYFLLFVALSTLFYSCEKVTVRMEEYPIQGIDISHHQSFIDWDKIKEQGVKFVFVKATEGESVFDSLYCYNWAELERIGMRKGAYHFYRPDVASEKQVRHYLRNTDLRQGDLPPVLDVEVTIGVRKKELVAGVKNWLQEVEIHYNTKPIIYTNYKFYHKYLSGKFNDYPIWIARYSNRNPSLGFGKEWVFWQYGNKGQLDGIVGDVDFNVFNGTQEQLDQFGISPNWFSSIPLNKAQPIK